LKKRGEKHKRKGKKLSADGGIKKGQKNTAKGGKK
jgi:hypothetical protein